MKKIFFGMAALVAMVATSCQQTPDLAEVGVGGETATVSFNLGTPQIASRADFSDGTTASHLQWAVYDANGNILNDLKGEMTDFQISTTVEFQLTTGNTYYVLFWAAAPSAPYTVDLAAQTMTVNYTGAVSSDENRDAFYYYDDFTVQNGMDPVKAELRRPFAQLNIGTNDFEASEKAGHKVTHAMVEVPAYSTLNFANGEVSDKAVRKFAYAAVPGASQEFPVNDAEYDYIAMNYLLMASTKETVDVKFTYATDENGTAAKERTVGAVPVQRNHRTNLYGQLFTSNTKVNVEIKPEYDDKHNGVIEVATAEQFNTAFADPDVDFIVLAGDITLTTSVTRTNPTLAVSAGETLTLKLNDHRLTAESTLLFDVQGTLIIENGTIENTTGQVYDSSDNVTFSNVTVLQTTDSAYYDEDGGKLELLAEGVVKVSDDNYAITAATGMAWFAENVAACNGKTIELYSDITLPDGFYPIGYNSGNIIDFTGVFDGNGHTIYNLKREDLNYSNKRAIGLFSRVNNATIKDLNLEDFVAATYGGEAAAIACVATGTCTFENLTFTKGSVVAYNNDTAAVVGWANVGNFTFKNIDIASDVTIFSLWNSYDTTVGGVIGTLEGPSTVLLEDINIACKLDAYNDVSANYQWGVYRRAGMIIGNMDNTQNINGTTYPDPAAAGVTCKNVTVTYGKWMNYHYCEFKSNGHGSYDDDQTWKCSRVEGSDWGSNTIDTSKCQHESFESHNMCLPIDQLFGGGQGVYGLASYDGVTVNYPAEYTCPTCGQQHNVGK